MKSRLLSIGIAVIGIAVLVALTIKYVSKATPPLEEIRIATPNFALSALLFVAEQKGMFKNEGLAVSLIKQPFGKDSLDMTLSGQAEFTTVASLPLSAAILGGAKPSILATIGKSEHDHMIVANGDRAITQVADLRGKTVAVPYGTTLQFYLDAALIDAGISPSEVTTVDLADCDALTALTKGTVDAALQIAPLTERGITVLGFYPTMFSPTLYTMHWNLVTSRDLLATRPEVAKKLLRALIAAQSYVEENPDQSIEVTARHTGIAAIDIAARWPEYRFQVQLPQSLIVALEDEVRWANSRRNASSPSIPSPNFLNYMRSAPLHSVQPDAVRMTK